MADKEAIKHNHPYLVKARRDAYFAGRRDGFKDGFVGGEVHDYYRQCIRALELRVQAQQEKIQTLREEIERWQKSSGSN